MSGPGPGGPSDPAARLRVRGAQLRAWGVPASTLAAVARELRDAGPEGWVPAWVRAGEAAERAHRLLTAAMLYGAAKLPGVDGDGAVAADRREAYARQLACFERAARRFPCYFERQAVEAAGARVMTHYYAALWHSRAHQRERPLVLLVGGAEVWKIELHRLALAIAVAGDLPVVAVDLPGTGEAPLAPDLDAEALLAEVLAARAADLGGVRPYAAIGVGLGGRLATRLVEGGLVVAAAALGDEVGPAPAGSASSPVRTASMLVLPDAGNRPRRATLAAIAWLRRRLRGTEMRYPGGG